MKLSIDNNIISTINAIPNPVILTDGKYLQSANTAFLEFINSDSIEEFNLCKGNLSEIFVKHGNFFAPSDIEPDQNWADFLFHSEDLKRIVSIYNKNGELRDFDITIKKIENQKEYLIVFNDITSYILEKNEYKYFAYHDHLTKIYNRQKFDEEFLKAMENKKRYKDELGIMLIDIDYFKKVNDTYGHLIGDLVLVLLVNLIKTKLRINDILARWGGEEFIILLPRTNAKSSYKKAEELRDLVESHLDKNLPQITISIGLTEINDSDNINSSIQRADEALFLAKEKRNNVIIL